MKNPVKDYFFVPAVLLKLGVTMYFLFNQEPNLKLSYVLTVISWWLLFWSINHNDNCTDALRKIHGKDHYHVRQS